MRAAICREHGANQVVFAYSDVPHEWVMHAASRVLACGADFVLLGPDRTMLQSCRPVIAIGAVRTGAGKSQIARWLSQRLREALELFYATASDAALRLDLPFEVGDIQFLHNHLILHGRTRYTDWPEPGRKRHLMRLWLSMPDGRVLPEAFRERYTVIELGRPRGGIHVPGLVRKLPLDVETPAYR